MKCPSNPFLFLWIVSVALLPAGAPANTITSSNFSVTLGATYINGAAVCWTPSENAASNTPTRIGDFCFHVLTPSGRAFTQNGPTFTNGILATGGTTNVTGNATDLLLIVSGAYDGLLPPGSKDIQVILSISRLSVWGWSSTTHTSVTNMYFAETTGGHQAVSPSVTLRSGPYSATAVANAANYTQLVWDPEDFPVALTASTRTFNLNGGGVPLCVEGLTVEGKVVFRYTPVAQPPPPAPPVSCPGLLVADSFATVYIGHDQNTELARQSGALAPVAYSDLPFTANSWQSQLTGAGLVLYPTSAYPMPGLRTDHNFTNSPLVKVAVELDAIADGCWAALAIGCSSGSASVFDTNGFAIQVCGNGLVKAISQGVPFLTALEPATDRYQLELELSTPAAYDGSGVAFIKAHLNGLALDLNGAAPGISIGRPGFAGNHVLFQASSSTPAFAPAARFKNFVVVDLSPRPLSQETLFQDTFNSAYSGWNVNGGEGRQSGPWAPVRYSRVTTDPSGDWRIELNGHGISLHADNGHLAAVRTDVNFTNSGRFRTSVRIRPLDYRPHNRFGIGCSAADVDPTISSTGVGVMVWRNSGHVFLFDRGSVVFDGFVSATSDYLVELDADTPAAFDGKGQAVIGLRVNGCIMDLNGGAEGTTHCRPGLSVNHILMTSFIAAAGTNTVFDDLRITRLDPAFAPKMQIAPMPSNQATICWPAIATVWDLERTASLLSAGWTPVGAMTTEQGNRRCVVLNLEDEAGFFRLRASQTNWNLTNDTQAVATIPVESHVLVATNAGLWPTLVLLSHGDLLAFGHNQPGHTTLPGDTDCWASTDGGKSWQKRATAAARSSTNANWVDSCAGVAANGDLLLLTGGYTDPGGALRAPSPPGLFRSTDHGFTWLQRGFFPARLPLGELSRPYGQIVRAADGTLRTVVYDQFGTGTAYMLISRDDGLSWDEATLVGVGINESVLFEIRPGHWLAIGRTVSKPAPVNGQELQQYRSYDNGRTWHDEGLIAGYSKHPPKLTRLRDQRLLLTYCNRRTGAIEVRFSSNEGKVWTVPRSVALAGGDRGYPDSVQLASGKVVTVYYAQSTSLCAGYQMAAVVWTPPAP